MPKLGDFIGALLSDTVQARVRADIESLKIAEAYSEHELLKYFPVPRFRLPDITIDFPVMVSAMEGEPPAGGGKVFDEPNPSDMTRIVRRALIESGIRLAFKERRKVYTAVNRRSKQLFQIGPQILLNSQRVSKSIAEATSIVVKNLLKIRTEDAYKVPILEGTVKSSVRSLLLTKLAQSPHLQVNIASSDIKSHGDNDSLLRVRLTIAEDAYEVVTRENGDQGFTLTPE